MKVSTLCSLAQRRGVELHEVGLTERLYQPSEFSKLLDRGVAFTDLSKLGSGIDHHVALGRGVRTLGCEAMATARHVDASVILGGGPAYPHAIGWNFVTSERRPLHIGRS